MEAKGRGDISHFIKMLSLFSDVIFSEEFYITAVEDATTARLLKEIKNIVYRS